MAYKLRFECRVAPLREQCGLAEIDVSKLRDLDQQWFREDPTRLVGVPGVLRDTACRLRELPEGYAPRDGEYVVTWLRFFTDVGGLNLRVLAPLFGAEGFTGLRYAHSAPDFVIDNVSYDRSIWADVTELQEAYSLPLLGEGIYNTNGRKVATANYNACSCGRYHVSMVSAEPEDPEAGQPHIFKYTLYGEPSTGYECIPSEDAAGEGVILAVLTDRPCAFRLRIHDRKKKHE